METQDTRRREQIESRIQLLLNSLTTEEKVFMLSGRDFFAAIQKKEPYNAHPYAVGGGCTRLRVPSLLFADGPRGVLCGHSTCFPCSMARGASFDTGLEEKIGDAIGRELRAHGCNLYGGGA